MSIEQEVVKRLKHFTKLEKVEFQEKYFDTKLESTLPKDIFLGVTVPDTRIVAKEYKGITLDKIGELLQSQIHEVRLLALIILVAQFKKADEVARKSIVDFYLAHTKFINNWDLVDTSASFIVGAYFADKSRDLLYKLAVSNYLWERRIAIIATHYFIKQGQLEDTYEISKLLLKDTNHYIHKAVGWMLREAGKKDEKRLKEFLTAHIQTVPRTTLRYAIEKFSSEERTYFLALK